MAAGDLTVFNKFAEYIGEGVINLETDDIKLALITNAGGAPSVTEAAPTWATYSANQVAEFVGGYVTGGVSLTTPALTLSGAVATFDDTGAAGITITQNGSGFDDAYYGILYSETAGTNEAIAFMDLNGPVSQIAGDITITWHGSGILTITRS